MQRGPWKAKPQLTALLERIDKSQAEVKRLTTQNETMALYLDNLTRNKCVKRSKSLDIQKLNFELGVQAPRQWAVNEREHG